MFTYVAVVGLREHGGNIVLNGGGGGVEGAILANNLVIFDNSTIHKILSYGDGFFIKTVKLGTDPLYTDFGLQDFGVDSEGMLNHFGIGECTGLTCSKSEEIN